MRLPSSVDSDDAGDFLKFSALSDALVLETWGDLDRATPPEGRIQYWKDNAYARKQFFFVRIDGRMVARAWTRFEQQENLGSATFHVGVLNAHTGRGIGRALLSHAEALAAAAGRTTLMTFTEHPADFDADGHDVLKPATGTGALPAVARAVRFAASAGYRLEQVERFSSLTLPVDPGRLDALEREAMAKSQDDDLVSWTDRCPDEYVGQLAVLMSRMSRDAPMGALSHEEETWDVARVRHVENTWQRAGNVSLVTAARHRASGELAAYTVLALAPGKPWLADQDDTLVAADHRGHHGSVWSRRNPWNGGPNRHMLADESPATAGFPAPWWTAERLG